MDMYATVLETIKIASQTLKLNPDQLAEITKINHVHEATLKTSFGEFAAYRVQHNNNLGPYKGGVRFHPNVDINEVKALATLMSLKTSLAGIPLGGAKGGIAVDVVDLTTNQLEELSRAYVRAFVDFVGPNQDIPAPDVNTGSQTMDWMVDEYSQLTGDTTKGSFTGKSLENGGSLGRTAATGHGGVIALQDYLKVFGDELPGEPSIALQGYGNVGAYFATTAKDFGLSWKFNAISDSRATLDASNLDVDSLAEYKEQGGSFKDYPSGQSGPVEQVLSTPADILVLAALENAVDGGNVGGIQAKLIVELANGPITGDAAVILEGRGIPVIPGILANSGGVIVSYFEWLQNLQRESWTEQKVTVELGKLMHASSTATYDFAKNNAITIPVAAACVAIQRIIHS